MHTNVCVKLGVVALLFNPSTQVEETADFCEFKPRLFYTVRFRRARALM